ncbi:MAG TPA: serine hydrolase domain-containing protein [Thermoanaerobaculia bacterium]|jgi:CubicO group peptidase (beta-lactamase class C family)|nr:serine hydrolase domain-containing protein [Thermoanaerobaculia bacterium]
MSTTLRYLAVLAVLLCLAGCAKHPTQPHDQLDAKTAERIDDLFERFDNPRVPGCNVGVAREGRFVYQKSFGAADLDYPIANDADTRFPIGSNSKQFTAMVVALLAEDGKLSLADDVRKWVPELPAYAKPITIGDLLHHTSGLRDYQALRFLSGTPPDYLDLDWVLALLVEQHGTHFPAGEQFEYSNSNYVLARVVAERAGGKTLRQLARERIFEPLGMRNTAWDETGKRTMPHRATPYAGNLADGWKRSLGSTLAGSGGVWTTVGDLLRWDENFYRNRLGRGDPELVRRAVTPSPASLHARAAGEDERGGYGMGIFLGTHHGRPVQWHAGRGPGHVGDMARYPRQHVSVFCLCNSSVDTRFLVRSIADIVLGVPKEPTAAAAAHKPYVAIAPPLVAATEGDYLNPVSGTTWTLRADPESPAKIALRVVGADYMLSATGPDEYFLTDPPLGWRVTVARDAAGKGQRLTLFEEGRETAHYARLAAPPPAGELAAYVGAYDSDELDNPYTIRLVNGALQLDTKLQPKGTLQYGGPDRFVLPTDWFTLIFTFTRDPSGKVNGFNLDSGAANGFHFARRR